MAPLTRFALAACVLCACVLAFAPHAAADRPDTPGTSEIFRYEPGDVVETYGSPGGRFLVHFTRMGRNAVPAADLDASGVPDHVESVAAIYDEVLAFYQGTLGYRPPLPDGVIADNGGDDRFDVYLLEFGGGSDGSFRTDACGLSGAPAGRCVGFMDQENDFFGYGYPSIDYANRLLASHEFFHAVQAAYDSAQGAVISEGTAVWASERFDPALRDIEGFCDGYLSMTARPIDSPPVGPVPSFAYGSSIFFEFLSERYGDDVILETWEATDTMQWLPALDALLASSHASTFASAFRDFSEWNLFTGSRADAAHYMNGARYTTVVSTPITLPYTTTSPLRVYYASAQYFSAVAGGRTAVTAAMTGDSTGLALLLAVRRGDVITVATGATADTMDADEVFVVVLNTGISGSSIRPGLCVGTVPEVATCVGSAMPDAGMPDLGTSMPDSGTSGDAAMPMPDAGTMTPGGGCCAVAGTGGNAPGGALTVLLALAALLARVRASRKGYP